MAGGSLLRFKPGRPMDDQELVEVTAWPKGLTASDIRSRILKTLRWIDFDETMVVWKRNGSGYRVRKIFCRQPVLEFLGEKPFGMETWNPKDAKEFFEMRPLWPQPTLILVPPRTWIGEEMYKDLAAIGLHPDAEIYDDFGKKGVYAPGHRIVSEFS